MTTFAPADYERIRKALGYPVNALFGISRNADRFARDLDSNPANVDYVAAVKDLLDLIEETDEAIALEMSDGGYSVQSLSIPNEISIQRSTLAKGSTSADGLYSKRGGYIRQLEDLLRPYGMFNQAGRVERG
jgi:hypothetical protein